MTGDQLAPTGMATRSVPNNPSFYLPQPFYIFRIRNEIYEGEKGKEGEKERRERGRERKIAIETKRVTHEAQKSAANDDRGNLYIGFDMVMLHARIHTHTYLPLSPMMSSLNR